MKLCRFCLVFFSIVIACSAQSDQHAIPPVKTKALNDTQVMLPIPGRGQVLVLVLGFSHKSADEIEVWGKHLASDFHDNAHVAYYQMPELQGVPGLVKPMILRGMRKDIPEAEYPHVAPIYDRKKEWQDVVYFSAPDDAYVLIATPDGLPMGRVHGPFSDEMYNELKMLIAAAVERVSSQTR